MFHEANRREESVAPHTDRLLHVSRGGERGTVIELSSTTRIAPMAAQPCTRGAADATTATSSTVWVRDPTRVVPDLARRQPHLCQTPHVLSHYLARSAGAA